MSYKKNESLNESLLDDNLSEDPNFLSKQLITYIGNKRRLLNFIGEGVEIVKNKLGKNRLDIFDVFSGSGIVSRFFKQHSNLLITNDLEDYANAINTCYLSNADAVPLEKLKTEYNVLLSKLKEENLIEGIIAKNYAPANDDNIQLNERVFYTARNAKYIDTARQLIAKLDIKYQPFFLAPLLSEASIHSNTSGVFKGFYKSKKTGIGKFGGSSENALCRIKGNIHLPFPIFSNFHCKTMIFQGDANKIAEKVPTVDLAYLDPPYNQHPYGSNYFMLNLILNYKEPKKISTVSGIPEDWNRSEYNRRGNAYQTFKELVTKIKAKYILISFNSEGFISKKAMIDLLKNIGKLTILEQKYNTFRGSRNLKNRSIHIKEYLYLLEK